MLLKTEILYGVHPVLEAIRATQREIWEVFLDSGKRGGRLVDIEQLALQAGIKVTSSSPEKLTALIGNKRHQGAAARVGPLPLYGLPDIIVARQTPNAFLLLLDQILDPHNLGALIRTALCGRRGWDYLPSGQSSCAHTGRVSDIGR